MNVSIKVLLVACCCFAFQKNTAAQTIQQAVDGQWINMYYVNGNSIQIAKNGEWVDLLHVDGSVVKLYKNGQWINQYNIDGTTAQEAINGRWMSRYYPKGKFIQKSVDGAWHNEWRLNGNYIQEWAGFGWSNVYYFPDGLMNVTLVSCILDAGKFKVNQPSRPVVQQKPAPPAAGGISSNPNTGYSNSSRTSSTNNQSNPSRQKHCTGPSMGSSDFAATLETIKAARYDDDRLKLTKQIAKTNCLSSNQVKQIIEEMSYDDARLEFAKYAYLHVYDQNKYHLINDAFRYPSNTEELSKYIINLN